MDSKVVISGEKLTSKVSIHVRRDFAKWDMFLDQHSTLQSINHSPVSSVKLYKILKSYCRFSELAC